MTQNDFLALIALYGKNNKQGLIQAMNLSGYPVSQNISDTDLFNAVLNVYTTRGLSAAKAVLVRVPLYTSQLTEQQAKNLSVKFGANPNAPSGKFKDWFAQFTGQVGDFLGGTQTVTQSGAQSIQTSGSVLPTWAIIATVVLAVAGIAIFRKFTVAVIGIIVIAMGVFLYGIFVRNKTTTQTGPSVTTNVHNGALSWLQGILDGLNLSVVGGG